MSDEGITLADIISHMNNGFRQLRGDINAAQQQTNQRFDRLATELKAMHNRLGIIEQDVISLREDIRALSGEVVQIKTFVGMPTNSY